MRKIGTLKYGGQKSVDEKIHDKIHDIPLDLLTESIGPMAVIQVISKIGDIFSHISHTERQAATQSKKKHRPLPA